MTFFKTKSLENTGYRVTLCLGFLKPCCISLTKQVNFCNVSFVLLSVNCNTIWMLEKIPPWLCGCTVCCAWKKLVRKVLSTIQILKLQGLPLAHSENTLNQQTVFKYNFTGQLVLAGSYVCSYTVIMIQGPVCLKYVRSNRWCPKIRLEWISTINVLGILMNDNHLIYVLSFNDTLG